MQPAAYRKQLIAKISQIGQHDYHQLALEVFRYQAAYNPLYAEYLSLLSVDKGSVKSVERIPFLPIELFKKYRIQTGDWKEETVFTSSGTTGQISSRHYLRSSEWYRTISRSGFEHFYGKLTDLCILALLPSYLERRGSSLVFMVQDFIKISKYPESGFFLHDFQQLRDTLLKCVEKNIPTILLGVSFGLLDFAEQSPLDLKNTMVMETGGMKGRRKEITRQELHGQLKAAFQVEKIHSEYGMTELLSQAYSSSEGLFRCSPSMKVLSREVTDPLSLQKPGRTGVLNIIDLANIDTCSFIATDDLGKVYEDGAFEVLGRMDYSDIRGCNLMVGEG